MNEYFLALGSLLASAGVFVGGISIIISAMVSWFRA